METERPEIKETWNTFSVLSVLLQLKPKKLNAPWYKASFFLKWVQNKHESDGFGHLIPKSTRSRSNTEELHAEGGGAPNSFSNPFNPNKWSHEIADKPLH
jgi:hypothetical protein